MLRLGLNTLGLNRARGAGGGAATASEQLLTLATDDGWTALHDPTNPDTRTLRNDGSNDYISAVSDGLGNLPDLAQGTAANQPLLSVGAFGQLDAALGAEPDTHLITTAFTTKSQPNFFATVVRLDNTSITRHFFDNESTGSPRETFYAPSGGNWRIFAGSAANSGIAVDTNSHVVGCLFNGASSRIWIDGADSGAVDAGTEGFALLSFLGRKTFSTWVGPGGPIAYFNGDPGATKRNAMFDKLHDLSGIAKA